MRLPKSMLVVLTVVFALSAQARNRWGTPAIDSDICDGK